MISIEIQEWQEMKAKLSQLKQEIFFLRNQNTRLKKLMDLKQKQDDNNSQSSGNLSIDQDVKEKYGMTDLINEQDNFIENHHKHLAYARSQGYHSGNLNKGWDSNDLDEEKHDFERQLYMNKENLYPECIDEIRVSRKSQQSDELKNLISIIGSSQKSRSKQLPLIQEICLFGPALWQQNLKTITFKDDQKQLVQPALYYPQVSLDYKQYGNYLFPKKVRIKPTQKTKIPVEGNKIIFKSSKKQESNIFIFQGNQQMHPIKSPHKMLENVNPSKWLYAIVIEFNDFVYQQIGNEQRQRQSEKYIMKSDQECFSPLLRKKTRGSLLELDLQKVIQQQIHLQTVSLKDIELQKQKTRMFRSTFCLCIFTYFPYITYLQGIITAIFDQVKLKRIEHFPKTGEFKDCDIFYFINELQNVAKKIKSYFWQHPVKIGKELSLKINVTLLQIDLSEEQMCKELYGNWAYRLMKMMDRDVFYEIYCMVMLQQSVSFVCENQRTLTFMILLFSSMLTKPFVYPYPVVSVLFTEELLQTPFTSIVGINQSEEWLRYEIESGLIDSQNKHFVIITEKEVKIQRASTYNVVKSEGLRKIFTRFYKQTQPSSLTNILLRRDTVSFNQNVKQTDEYVIDLFVKLQLFYHENIFMFMPSNMKVPRRQQQIQQQREEVNKVAVRNNFLNQIEKQYKKSNPNYWKDEFIKEFVKTQIFSIYLMNQYQLQE